MSSPRILRRIRKEFDFETYIGEHYQTKRTSRDNEVRVCCPSCGDSKYKLYVNNEKKMFNCYKCDFSSGNFDVFDFVAITEGLSRGAATLRLAAEFAPTTPLTMEECMAKLEGSYVDVVEDEAGKSSDIQFIDGLPPEASLLLGDPLVNKLVEDEFWMYLNEVRGLTHEEVKAAKIHYVAHTSVPVEKNGKYAGDIGRKIIFPVYGPGGRLVSWLSRPITEDYKGPKYVNCPGSELNRTLWPFIEPHVGAVVLVEGIFDCMAVRRLGPPFSAYVTFGKKIGHDQIEHLKAWGVEDVTVFYDPDAKRDIVRAVNELKMHFNCSVPNLSEWPSGSDPGDMLNDPDGVEHLERALCNPIDVDSLEYVAWQIQ
jgi:DNA primase